MKTWGGIDPGLDGAVVFIHENGDMEVYDAPVAEVKQGRKTRRVLVPQDMVRMFEHLVPTNVHVYVESVHAFEKQSPNSMFNFGAGYGYWIGILSALAIPYTLVTPQRWKKELLTGMGKDKSASCVRAAQLWPSMSGVFSRPKQRGTGLIYLDGRGDAACLATLCKRENP